MATLIVCPENNEVEQLMKKLIIGGLLSLFLAYGVNLKASCNNTYESLNNTVDLRKSIDGDNDSTLTLKIVGDEYLPAGSMKEIALTFAEAKTLIGMQLSLQFNMDLVEEIIPMENKAANITKNDFGLKNLENGLLNFSWMVPEGVRFQNGEELFHLKVRMKVGAGVREIITLRDGPLKAEAYDEALQIIPVELEFTEATEIKEVSMHRGLRLSPNPFKSIMRVVFPGEIPIVDCTVFNIYGRKVYHRSLNRSMKAILLHGSDLPHAGMYFLVIQTGKEALTQRFIYQK